MKTTLSRSAVVVGLLLISSYSPFAAADVSLPKAIGSHMVLQRDRALPIWGWAEAGEEVTVQLDETKATAKADDKGNWKVELPAMKADGKAHKMTIQGKNKIELEDLLVGDVWIGSGQSNMEWNVKQSHNASVAIPEATDKQIRLMHVAKVQNKEKAKDVTSPGWQVCSPQTVPGQSGVLYFFGQRLRKEIDVPVGLISSSWGGSPIEPWTVADGKGGGMYNGMIGPVHPLAIRGVIWYQGESNIGNGLKYADKMKALIEGWRKEWGYDFPFYYVQIAPFAGYGQGALPILWEAQTAALKIPNTGMSVTTDLVHNIKDIHPVNKVDVGNRLALWALAKEYKKDVVYSGPIYKSMKADGDKIRISFAHVGGGLKSRNDQPLSDFEIAGEDGKYVKAEATIDGNTIVVQSKDVAQPVNVRFGWSNQVNPNLINKEGLPASPFQTKDWQGGTGE